MSILDKLLWRSFFDRKVSRTAFRRPRAYPRVPIEERAELRRVRDTEPEQVVLVDLSIGGARISTPLRLREGEDVTLVVDPSRRMPFTLGCLVIFSNRMLGKIHGDYGLKFTAVKPGDIERLRKFVAGRDDARRNGAAII